jgi:hypothetical protein
LVKKVRDRPLAETNPIQMCNNKLRPTGKYLGGWARHLPDQLKKKFRLSSLIDELEAFVEVTPLSMQEIELKSQYNGQIASLLCNYDVKWYERWEVQFILEETSNTRYFPIVANSRHWKKLIHSLVHDDGTIKGHEQLISYIINYHKNWFGKPEEGNFSMDESQIDENSRVSDEENAYFTAPYTKDEIRKVFSNGTQQGSRSIWFPGKVLSKLLGDNQDGHDGTVQCYS